MSGRKTRSERKAFATEYAVFGMARDRVSHAKRRYSKWLRGWNERRYGEPPCCGNCSNAEFTIRVAANGGVYESDDPMYCPLIDEYVPLDRQSCDEWDGV